MLRLIVFVLIAVGPATMFFTHAGETQAYCWLLPAEEPSDYSSLIDYLRIDDLKCTVYGDMTQDGKSIQFGQSYDNQQPFLTMDRGIVLGSLSVGLGTASYFGAIAMISAYGTASTGVAISSLGGAAAANATFAWLGGGSLAVGGGGVAAGTAVAATGVGLVVIGTVAVGAGVWHLVDKHQETMRISFMLDKFQDSAVLDKVLSKESTYNIYQNAGSQR